MVEANQVKLLSDKLQTRMGTIEILAYAYTLNECEKILSQLSKRSRIFFQKNRNDLKAMCVCLRATPFSGKLLPDQTGYESIIFPFGLDLKPSANEGKETFDF